MHRIIRTKAYEAKHGPHFDEEHARKAVSKMVPPQMKQMLPQNIQNAMNEAS